MRNSLFSNLAAVIATLFLQVAKAGEPVDFGRDIRQILSDKCFLCHGPDDETRQADLRLDLRSAAVQSAITPLKPESSELMARINSKDPELVMPPPATGKSVTREEAELLSRWIKSGARYTAHWAFEPPVRPVVPDPTENEWVRNPIDAFVRQRQKQNGLSPAPVADKETLARRMFLDIIGLPPSPADLDKVLANPSPAALGELAEELFQTEQYGEHWARWWLDAARYADSDGYEKDKPREVWFYRDWVVDALNNNMPYDQFVLQQIAGDLLPNASQSQRVATGFLRNSMVNEEGGADPEQFRVEAMFDRVDAIGKAMLGITTQCAQCHTHKYDPLSHEEYYQMFAALNDFHEASISVFTPTQAKQRDVILEKIAAIEHSIKRRVTDWQSRIESWIEEAQNQLSHWRTLVPTELPYEGQKFRLLDDGSILSESYAPTRATNTFSLRTAAPKITAFRIDLLTHPQLPRGGPGRSILGTGAISEFEITIAPADRPNEKRLIKIARAIADVNPKRCKLLPMYRDRDPSKDDRVTGPVDYAIDGDGKTAWSTDNGPGRRNQSRHAIFIPESEIISDGEIIVSFTLKQNHGGWNSDDNQNYLVGRYRFSITDDEIGASTLPTNIENIIYKNEQDRSQAETHELFSHWITTLPELDQERAAIESAWSEFPETGSQLVVESMGEARDTFVYTRGDFLNRGQKVAPGTPSFLGELPASNEPDRLRFARWIVRPDAPTTARVIVNRIWQAYFGRGIVASPEDFGYQSAPPSHPELLDWLSVELMENGWDLQHIHRLIIDSATYRQSSVLSQEAFTSDPQNQWLARGPRFRVNAEVVRDIALAASGLLNNQVGGPSVFPPAPEFLFKPPASYGPKIWNTAQDSQQYRRSLYIHSYRSVPYPALQVFDAPKGDTACIRRERSNTPLQALVILNEPQFFECARALANRIAREANPDDRDRIIYGYRLTVGRIPEPEEISVLQTLLALQRDRLAVDDMDLAAVLGMQPTIYQQATGREAAEIVPWIMVSRVLLNLDETITKQ